MPAAADDDAPGGAPTPWRMAARGAVARCPLCGGGGLFTRWFTLRERCPTCGLRFDRKPEEGFFLGAYTLNLGLTLGLLALALFGFGLAVGEVVPGPPWAYLVVATLSATVVPLLGYPPSKTLWSAIDLAMHPPEPVEQAEAAMWLARQPEGEAAATAPRRRRGGPRR